MRLAVVLVRQDNTHDGRMVTIDSDMGEVTATAGHPFWVVRGDELADRPICTELAVGEDEGRSLAGRWVHSHDLRVGDTVYLKGRGEQRIRRVWIRAESHPVCNLTVGGLHNFVVGEAGYLVHNTSGSLNQGDNAAKGAGKTDTPPPKDPPPAPKAPEPDPVPPPGPPTGTTGGGGGTGGGGTGVGSGGVAPAAPIPRGPKPVTGTKPGSYLDEAVAQQGLSKAPAGGLKQKWSEGGFDYEVRVHPADPAHGKTGSIYRVRRRMQGRDANNQGAGREYMDSAGKWHPESTLKPGKPGHPNPTYNDAAARDTHIQLPPDVPPP